MLLTRPQLAAAAGAVGLGLLGAATLAHAYPPGKHLTVTVSPAPAVAGSDASLTVTLAQGRPGASAEVSLSTDDGIVVAQGRGTVGPNGTATVVIPGATLAQVKPATRLQVQGRATASGAAESAGTFYTVTDQVVVAPQSAKAGVTFPVTVARFPGRALITVTAIRGTNRVVLQGITDEGGSLTGRLTLPRAGVWSVVATCEGISAIDTVRVTD